MKTINSFAKLFIYCLLFIIFLMVLISCQTNASKNYETTECSVLIDITSSNMPSLKHISSEELIKLYKLDVANFDAGIYRQAFLTETFLNYTHQHLLNGVPSVLMNNSFDREEAIEAFKNQIGSAVDEIQHAEMNRPSSSVYVPICRELTRLSRSKSERKILLGYTDLKENSDYLSFLSEKARSDLEHSPDKIENYLQLEMPLPEDLTGITVYFIHEPSGADNFLFKRLSRVYKSMIENRGGKVYIQANLQL
jgi:hypothetical protein